MQTATKEKTIQWIIGIVMASASLMVLVSAMPLFVGQLHQYYGLSEANSALTIGAELASAAIACALIAKWANRINRFHVTVIGLFIAIACNMLMFFFDTPQSVVLIRIACGFGAGLAFGCGYSSMANLERPAIALAFMGIVVTIGTLILFFLEAPLEVHFGKGTPFGILTVFNILALPCAALMPRKAIDLAPDMDIPGFSIDDIRLKLLASYLFSVTAFSTVYPFLEGIGQKIFNRSDVVNSTIGGAAFFAIVVTVVIAAFMHRFFYKNIVLLAILLAAGGSTALVFSSNLWIFAIGTFCIATAASIGQMAYNDYGARSDRSGRLSAQMSSLSAATFAFSPLAGGVAMTIGGINFVLIVTLLGLAAGFLLCPGRQKSDQTFSLDHKV